MKFWRNLVEMILAATVHISHVLMKNTTCKFKQWHNTWCLMFTRHWKRCSNKVVCSINEDNSKLVYLKSASIFHLVWWIWNCSVLYKASYSLVNCDSHVSAAACGSQSQHSSGQAHQKGVPNGHTNLIKGSEGEELILHHPGGSALKCIACVDDGLGWRQLCQDGFERVLHRLGLGVDQHLYGKVVRAVADEAFTCKPNSET